MVQQCTEEQAGMAEDELTKEDFSSSLAWKMQNN